MAKHAVSFGVMLAVASATANAQQRVEVPATYEAGHFYATPTLANGHVLRLLVDTGGGGSGGWFVMFKAGVTRAALTSRPCTVDDESLEVVTTLDYREGQGLPTRSATPCHAPAVITSEEPADSMDGLLGSGYLPGQIWTFDYPAQKLWREASDWRSSADMHRATLGMLRNSKGTPQSGFARISVQVDGKPLDLLLDTGATAHPTEAGKIAGTEVTASGFGVTSYITTSQLERWHGQHPAWRVVNDGDDLGSRGPGKGARLIEVPHLVVAGWDVGPVWFTERPDANFTARPGNWLNMMDGPVAGALGANVYRHFRMTIDYPHGAAYLACSAGCRPTS